jgi:hypothetical protein
MREGTALESALGLLHLPSRVRTLRSRELPADLETLLRIVAGDDGALSQAMKTSELSESVVQAAASFYVEQILLHPEADSYRVLGAAPDATIDELRRNMALLLRWLHPDHEANSARALFANRVTQAWNDVKTAERRIVYDATRNNGVNGASARDPRNAAPSPVSRRPDDAPQRTSAYRAGRPVRRPKSIWRYLKHLMGQGRS